jgi:hypothetical protein
MPRQQTPDQQQNQKGMNPGTFNADDDEAGEGQLDGSDQQEDPQFDEGQGNQRQAQGQDGRRRPEENIDEDEAHQQPLP